MNPKNSKSQFVIKHGGVFYSLCADLPSNRLYAGSSDYGVYVFDRQSKKQEPLSVWRKHDNYVSTLALVRGGENAMVVSGSYDRRLIWWEARQGKTLRSIEAHQGWVRGLTVSPDGSLLVSVGDDMAAKVWDSESGKAMRTLSEHQAKTPQGFLNALYTVAFSPDGRHLATADRVGQVCIWEMATGKIAQKLHAPTLYTFDPKKRKRSIGGIRSVAFSPDGKQIALGGIGQVSNVDGFEGPARVELWDWQANKLLATGDGQGQKAIVNHVAFHPAGRWLIGGGGGSGGLLAFWDLKDVAKNPAEAKADEKAKERELPVHRVKFDGHIHRLELDAKSNVLYAAGHGRLETWGLG